MHELRDRLLRSGIAPAMVDRYVGELRDHLDDIVDELTAAGLPPAEARDAALLRLGAAEHLAAPMLADHRFRSFASRAPLLAWLALPLLAQAGLAALLTTIVVLAARNGLPPGDIGAIAGLLLLLAPIAIGWSLVAGAWRRRTALAWPALGIAATIVLGAALNLQIDPTAIAVSLATPALPQLALYALLTLAPLAGRNLRIV